jgi:hypothetical protein
MDDKNIELCSIAPKYPKQAFCMLLSFKTSTYSVPIYPLHQIFTDTNALYREIINSQNMFDDSTVMIDPNALCLPLQFCRSFPLIKEYWQNPTSPYTVVQRVNLFTQIIKQHSFYSMLVTPRSIDENGEGIFSPAIPFRKTATDKEIDTFMRISDYPVDEKASTAAIYTIDDPYRLNWSTGEKFNLPIVEYQSDSN